MSKVFAYYFFLLYLSAIFKPVAPIVKDILAHSFWEMEHMATIHHHHGNDHTHVEIEKSLDQNKETPSATKSEEPVSVHLFLQKTFISYNHLVAKKEYRLYNSDLSESVMQIITPPPKA